MNFVFGKYKFLFLFLFLTGSFLSNASVFSKGSEDKYSFEFVKTKVYNMKTDIWIYELYKNGEPVRMMNVYVSSNFDGARILVDSDFNTSWNMYYFSKKRFSDNFWDSYRMQESTVISLDIAVTTAVDHYIQDQIIGK